MHRCCSVFLLVITIMFAAALSGCFGKGSSTPGNGGVKTVTINPGANFSMDLGTTQIFSTSATDASGHAVLGAPQYFVASGTTGAPAPLSVASNGNACAGAWDSTVSICSPGNSGIAIVTAVVNGVSSPPTTVYVHLHVDSLQVVSAQTIPPQYDCYSQGQTWLYKAIAYNNGVDITSTVGQLSWSSTNLGVLTPTPYIPTNQPNVLNQVQITADSPGITQLYASISGTTSNPIPITTCLVKYIRVQAQGFNGNTMTVNNGSAISLQATAVDTLGFTLSRPPLTWSTTNPEVLSFGSLTTTTGANNATARANLGGGDVTASCTPPSCNIGVAGYESTLGVLPGLPVYASAGTLPNGLQGYGAVSVNVATTSQPPTYLAWAATTMCADVPGCTSILWELQPTQGGANPIVTSVTLPRTPNSMMFNYQPSGRLYLGSEEGLMYVDAGSSSATVSVVSGETTPCNVTLCGAVLAISNDGKQVVVSDDVSATPQVYIYNATPATGTAPVIDLVLPGTGGKNSPDIASSAAFSPDQSKIFILTNGGRMYVYSTVDVLGSVPIPATGTAAAFSADGSFAYVTGASGAGGLVSAYSMCSSPTSPSIELGSSAPLQNAPLQIFPSPNVSLDFPYISQNVLVLEPPNIQIFNAQFTQMPLAVTPPLPSHSQLTCNPPILNNLTVSPTLYNLGAGNFTPVYARLVGNGSEMIIVARHIPAVLVFNVPSGTTRAVPLVSNPDSPDPLSASASSDGSAVYVAACDHYVSGSSPPVCGAGSVHIVNTTSLGDYQQVPYINNTTNNMCNNLGANAPLCVANLVAVKPQ